MGGAYLLLFLHLLGAAIWVGGHLVLLLGVLPGALRSKDTGAVLAFEEGFERVGLSAFAVQILTGLALTANLRPDLATWFDAVDPIARAVMLKLALIVVTLALALHARLVLIPGLTPARLPWLALHILGVTGAAIALLAAGAAFRFGGVGL